MKILIHNFSFFTKSQTFIYHQVSELSKNNDVVLLGYTFENSDLFQTNVKKYNLKYYKHFIDKALTFLYKKITGIYISTSVLNRKGIINILKKEKVDIIHAHFGPVALLIFPIAKLLNIPLVVTFHGVDASPAYLKNKSYRRSLPSLFNYAKGIIIVSPHMIETLSLQKWSKKVHVIPCCIDTHFFSRNMSKRISASKIEIIHSGRLAPKKGVPDLIRAFINLSKRFDEIRLIIIGDGEEYEICQSLIARHNCSDKVTLCGAKSQSDVREALERADIFVLNSRTDDYGDMEGSPVSILEAMSLEVPVISTYHAGIPSIIQHNINGLLVKERDNAALTQAIELLITNAEDRKRLGKSARQTVINKYNKGIMIKNIEAILYS